MRDSGTGALMINMTNPSNPSFYLTGLKPDTGYRISVFASNSKGHSDPRIIQAFTIKSDGLTQLIETNESALATNMDDVLPINPLLIVTLIIVGVFMSVFLPISIVICVRKRKRSSMCQSSNQPNSAKTSNIANGRKTTLNGRVPCDNNQSNLKLLNSSDDIFSEFDDTGSNFSGIGTDQNKRIRSQDATKEPDLIPSYNSVTDRDNFALGNMVFQL